MNGVKIMTKRIIDCTKTINYLNEKLRMTKAYESGFCRIRCEHCPLDKKNSGEDVSCMQLELKHPERAVEIVQKWSDEHPRRTYLSELLKHHPDVSLNAYGIPIAAVGCPCGVDKCEKNRNCIECWNQPIPIEKDEE